MWKPVRPQSPRSRFPYPWGRAALLTLPLAGLSIVIFLQSPDPRPLPPEAPAAERPAPTPPPQTPPKEPEPPPIPPPEQGCPEGCKVPKRECTIKGNISFRTGERIYHLPDQQFYNATVIAPEQGERWFCTEEEAKANGWRRTKR